MAVPPDRREAERYPVNADVSCPFASPVVEDFGTVKVRDVSMMGVGLVLSRRVEPGTLLAVTLTNKAKNFSKTVVVRIIHSTAITGGYLVGGSFTTAISYQDM